MIEADFKQIIFFAISNLKRSGINLERLTCSNRDKCILFLIHSPLFVCSYFILRTAFLSTDKETVGKLITTFSSGFVQAMLKIVWFIYVRDGLMQLVQLAIDGTDEGRMIDASPGEKALLRKHSKFATIIATVFYASYTFIGSLLFLCPYLYSLATAKWLNPLGFKIDGVRYMKFANRFAVSIIALSPILSATTHPGYDVHLLYQEYLVFHLLNVVSNVDILYYSFVIYIAYQCDVCQHYLAILGDNPKDTSRLLRKIVVTHTEVIRFLTICGAVYELVIFVQIIGATICIVFSLAYMQYSPVRFGVGMTFNLGQIFITCMFSEMVKHKTAQTWAKVYMCNWLSLNERKDRRVYLMLLFNSQVERSFKPFGLFALSLETFVKILKSIFSFYTFLSYIM